MGAWIEIPPDGFGKQIIEVALFMGAWIEIFDNTVLCYECFGRTLHGCVD